MKFFGNNRRTDQEFVESVLFELDKLDLVPNSGLIKDINEERAIIVRSGVKNRAGPTHHAQGCVRTLRNLKDEDIGQQTYLLTHLLSGYVGVGRLRKKELLNRMYDHLIRDWNVVAITGKVHPRSDTTWWKEDDFYA